MTISPGSSPADTVNPVTDCRQSGVSDWADTVMTMAKARMSTAVIATNMPVVLVASLFMW